MHVCAGKGHHGSNSKAAVVIEQHLHQPTFMPRTCLDAYPAAPLVTSLVTMGQAAMQSAWRPRVGS
jgi:hypothetical protein